ncbi:uncharacterized protein LOC141830367 isoform X1 [Curcuma longa]|uniref:uncharacterized protein LOC141830367 isoform X1 n=1 Tax=Curcuma longa TaxID=136217 RepID=UPI003D9E2B1B
MGFDNECIVNIQSLPGEYFCPVCRTLIYPSEALQSQCTHLYCKPCLSYIAATTHACPYDGYLVTEADSKPLAESNKALGETIDKVAVNCLYQRSGCQWQGTLSECIAHCSSCTFGNSPVVCNRCGTQIIHRQVQEHTQICPGLQPQAQQLDNSHVQASAASSQTVSQDPTITSAAAPGSTAGTVTVAIPAAASASTSTAPSAAAPATASAIPSTAAAAASQSQTQANITAYAQAASQLPTQQWYQQQQLQQYQQYYQMYPGYDPYQQQYQQYAQYQPQAYPQYGQPQAQTQPVIQGQQQPSLYVQPQSQPQPQPQVHAQPIGQPQPRAQAVQTQQQQPLMPIQQALPQPQPQGQPQPGAQLAQMQVPQATVPVQQPYTQILPQTNQPPQAQIAAQQFVQPTPIQYAQPQPPQQMQVPPHQQPLQPQQHPQTLPQQQPHPHTQPQARPTAVQQPPMLPQMHPQHPNVHQQMQPQSIAQPQHPSNHPVTGHQSYQQTQSGAPPQRPMFVQTQQVVPQQPVQMPNPFPSQQPSQMPPPSGYMPTQVQQQPMLPPQRPAYPQQQPHLPVNQHGQQKHQYPTMHAQAQQQVFPSQQAHGHLLPGQQFPQTMVSSQQQMHPQGPQHIQHVTAQPHPHGPPAQGMAAHQTAIRPLTANTLPPQSIQQFPGGPGKPAQPALNQQSPNHSNLTRPGPSLTVTPESLKSHLSQPGGQAVSIASAGPPNSEVIDKMGISVELTNESVANSADGRLLNEISTTTDTKISHSESETDRKSGGDSKENDKQSEMASTLPEEEGMEPAEHKYGDKKEVADLVDGNQRPDVPNDGNAGENQSTEAKPDEKAGAPSEVRGSNVSSDAGIHKHSSLAAELKDSSGLTEGPHTGEFASKTKSQQLPAPERGHLQQPTLQNAAPPYEGTHFQTGYQDRSSSQLAWNGSVSGTRQAVPLSGPLPGKEGYQTQQIPYGHPSNATAATTRFSAPDRILPHHIPHPGASQDRRSQETLPYQIQLPGQNTAAGQMRPPGQNFPEHLPLQGQPSVVQESFRSSTGQPYGGGYHSDAHHDGPPGPGVPPSGRLPGHVGFPQHGFPEQALAPQGQGQSHMSQPHAGVRVSQHPQLVPNSGAFNTSSLMPRGPLFHPEDRGGPSHLGPSNALEPEMYDTRRPGFSDVRPDLLGKSNLIKANGIPGKMQVDSMHDPAFTLGLAEDRFKPFPDERFRPVPEDGMPRHFPLDPGRHNAGRREFEEDLKQFPRPSHLDSEGLRNFDSYNSSRPLDRGWQQTGPDIRAFDRPLPRPDGIPGPFAAGQTGSFPASRPGLENHMMDMLETRRPPGPHEEFDRHMDVLPPIRSPVRDYGALPSGRFGTTGKPRLGDIDSRELHGFTERSKPFNASSDLSAGSFHDSKISMPSMLGSGPMPGRFLREIPDGPRSFQMEQFESGEPFNQGRMPSGDPGFGGIHGRDFPNEAAPFSIHNVRGDMEAFELFKKRKPGTMGWCRICSIDCETVEGLDLHAQTREHQKMALNMVLAFKREANMKNRISESVVPREGKNKRKDFGKPLK